MNNINTSSETIQDALYLKNILGKLLANKDSKQTNNPIFKQFSAKYQELEKAINTSGMLLKNPETPDAQNIALPPEIEPEQNNSVIDLKQLDFEEIIKYIIDIAEHKGLFFKIDLSDKEMIINNILCNLDVYDKKTFINMTNEQKGAFAFNLGMLENRSIFLKCEKFINTIDAIKKIPLGQQKMFSDINSVKSIVREHPDLSLQEKTELLKKIKTIPPLDENDIIVYLTDPDYQNTRRNEIKNTATEYFKLLEGTEPMPDQYPACTGTSGKTIGIGEAPDNTCTGYFMYKTTSYMFIDETMNILLKDKQFIKEMEDSGVATNFVITEEFINTASYERNKLKNVLISQRGKEFKNKEEFEKALNNLMPTASKSDEEDKNFTFYLIDKNFLSNTFNRFKYIYFPTQESFEKALDNSNPEIKDNKYLKTALKGYTITSINDMEINFPKDKDLEINISSYGTDIKENDFKIMMFIWDTNLEFNINKSRLQLIDARIDNKQLNLIIENGKYTKLLNYGITVPEKISGSNIIFDKKEFQNALLYIKIINRTGCENTILVSSNSPIDINLYNVYIKNKYEPNKFIMNEQTLKSFMQEQSINIKRLLSILNKNELVEEFVINTCEDKEKEGLEIILDKYTKTMEIKAYATANTVSDKTMYNIPPMPPYLQVQLKTNPLLKFLSELSVVNNNNLSVLRGLNLFKIIIDLYIKTTPAAERMKFIKKQIIVKQQNKSPEKIQIFQLFDIISKINYVNQIRQ